jgi:hypothetical protein
LLNNNETPIKKSKLTIDLAGNEQFTNYFSIYKKKEKYKTIFDLNKNNTSSPNNYSKSSPTAIIFYTIKNYVPRFGPKKILTSIYLKSYRSKSNIKLINSS